MKQLKVFTVFTVLAMLLISCEKNNLSCTVTFGALGVEQNMTAHSLTRSQADQWCDDWANLPNVQQCVCN